MSAFNRFLALVLLLIIAVGSLAVFLTFTTILHASGLHLAGETWWPYSTPSELNVVITDPILAVGRYRWCWVFGSLAIFIISLLLIIFELRGVRPPRGLLLHRGESGSTVLYLSALTDLARWTGEDTAGVEALPKLRVSQRRNRINLRGTALLSPFVSASETAPVLEERLRASLERATGFPAKVRLKSRFQNPAARRRVR